MISAGHVTSIGEMRNVYKTLVGRPEWKRPNERPNCKWEDHIRWVGGKVWTGCISLRLGTSGRFL